MSIDGRDLARGPAPLVPAPPVEDRAPVLTVLAWLVVIVPLAVIAVLAYIIGTWAGGGMIGGLLSLVSTAAMAGLMWLAARRKH